MRVICSYKNQWLKKYYDKIVNLTNILFSYKNETFLLHYKAFYYSLQWSLFYLCVLLRFICKNVKYAYTTNKPWNRKIKFESLSSRNREHVVYVNILREKRKRNEGNVI